MFLALAMFTLRDLQKEYRQLFALKPISISQEKAFLLSMGVTSLYRNIPRKKGITTVCRAYEHFHRNNPPIPTNYLREMLKLILKDTSSFPIRSTERITSTNPWYCHGYQNGPCFCKYFFMVDIETQILSKNVVKPTICSLKTILPLLFLPDVIKPDIKTSSLNKQTHIILQSNLWLKSQI